MNLVLRRRLGVAVWLTGTMVALLWSGFRTIGMQVRGIGFAPPVLVSPLEAGRLKVINVALHEKVLLDTVVAELDATPLIEEQAVLQARLLAVQQETADTVQSTSRQFALGVEASQVNRARVLTGLRTDEALARTLRERVTRERAIALAGAQPAMVADDLERDLAVVDARISASRAELAVAEGATRSAEKRQADSPATNEWRVVETGRLLERVEGRIRRQGLTAGMEGQVSAIFLRAGDYVTPGAPVLQVSALSTLEVIGYVSAERVNRIAAGDPAKVVRATGEVLVGRVESVGSGPQRLPEQLWIEPGRTEWGVPVRIVLEGSEVGPDEPVTVKL